MSLCSIQFYVQKWTMLHKVPLHSFMNHDLDYLHEIVEGKGADRKRLRIHKIYKIGQN